MPRFLLRAAGCALLAVSLLGHAASNPFPTGPLRLLVGFPPGGGTDAVARLVADGLAAQYARPVAVENVPGETGTIAAGQAARAAPDGHTLLMGHVNSHAIAPHRARPPSYDPLKDFTGVAYIGYVPNVLTVHPGVPARSVQELLALARARPGYLRYASSGAGSTQHLGGLLVGKLAGTELVHVPYRGSGEALGDLLSGAVEIGFDALPPMLPHLLDGGLRALAVSAPRRLPQLPGVPTFAEAGIVGFDVTNWYGVVAPAGTPREVVLKLNEDINRALEQRDAKARLEALGVQRRPMSAPEFDGFLRAEGAKFGKLLKEAKLRIE